MDFTIEETLTHRPAAVQDALLDADFVHVTADLPKIGGAELLELTRNGDRARLRVRYRFNAPLSRAVTAVIDPGKLTWIDDATFDLAALRAEHVLLPDHYPDRLQSSYTSLLAPEGTGTRWTIRGALDVKAALVGGRVALVIVDGLRETAAAQASLLDDWLARR